MGEPRRLVAVASLWVAASVLAGCGLLPGGSDAAEDAEDAGDAGDAATEGLSWAPAPLSRDGLTVLAEADASGFALHTASGNKTFLPGINLGSTTPLHQPGELAVEATDYRRWFRQMGELGIRAVRIYTIHPRPRQLWHDPLTNEQYFGVVATDSSLVPDSGHELIPDSGPVEYVHVRADASYVLLDVTFRDDLPGSLTITSDTVSAVDGDDYRVALDLGRGTGQAWVREELDPIRLDTDAEIYQPDVGEEWHRYRLLTNRSVVVGGETLAPEHHDVGVLVEGPWDSEHPDHDSAATWNVDEDRRTVHVRVPWPMFGLGDPSSRTALGPGKPVTTEVVDGLELTFDADGVRTAMDYTWPTWNYVEHTERLKPGVEILAEAYRDLGR